MGELREVLALSGDSFVNTLKALRMDREAPEIKFITDGAGQQFNERHLRSLPLSEYMEEPEPGVVVGMDYEWVSSTVTSISGQDGRLIARKICDECELCGSNTFFPYLLVESEGSKWEEFGQLEKQLSVGFAAALASGEGWIGQDIPILGLVMTTYVSKLYIAWAVTCGEKPTYTKYVYKPLRSFMTDASIDADNLTILQGAIMRIHLWGTGDRRKTLESLLMERLIRMRSLDQAGDERVLPPSTTTATEEAPAQERTSPNTPSSTNPPAEPIQVVFPRRSERLRGRERRF